MAGVGRSLSKIIPVIRRRRALLALSVASAFVATSVGTVTHAAAPTKPDKPKPPHGGFHSPAYEPYDFSPARHERPKDRYEPAGGCYAVRSEVTGKYLTRSGDGFAATGG